MEGTAELSVGTPRVDAFDLRNEVSVAAAPEKVFDCLLDITGWWGSPYLMSREAVDIVLEPRPGGRVVEVWGTDEGSQWGTVTGIRRPRLLEITGTIGIDGPVLVVQRFELAGEVSDDVTLVVGDPRGREAYGEGLEWGTHLTEVAGVLGGEGRDPGVAVRRELDEAFGGEPS